MTCTSNHWRGSNQSKLFNLDVFLVVVPDMWNHANSNCAGKYQSPINVVTRKTLKDERLTAFQFDNYQQIFRGTIKNNGHSGEHISHWTSRSHQCFEAAVWTLCALYVCVHSSSGWHSSPEHRLGWRPAHHLQGRAVPPALGQQRRPRLRTHHRRGAVSHGGRLTLQHKTHTWYTVCTHIYKHNP